MKKLLIFGGTTEGRIISERCAAKGIHADICVTTDYGSDLLPSSPYIHILVGKKSPEDIAELLKSGYTAVVDATHPYAQNITANIRAALARTGFSERRYFRIKRAPAEHDDLAVYTDNTEQTVKLLKNTEGKIFIATGSKEISAFSDFAERSRIRVYDSPDNISVCKSSGFTDIITGKGPFSEYENTRDFSGCDILVTKDSGKEGGFSEKISAAHKLGMKVIIIKRPEEDGYYVDKAWGLINLLRDI